MLITFTLLAVACLVSILFTSFIWLDVLLAALGLALMIIVILKSDKRIIIYFAILTALIIIPFSKWYEPAIVRQATDAIESRVGAELEIVESTLERFFLNNISVLDSLNLLIANEDNLTDDKYQSWLEQLLPAYRNNFFNVALSNNLLATNVYPMTEANKTLLNINLGTLPNMGFVYRQVLASSRPAIIGPVKLIQGVSGLIKVIPVTSKPGIIISGVLSLETLKSELISVVPKSSLLTLSVTGYGEPYLLIDQGVLDTGVQKSFQFQDFQVDVAIQSSLLNTVTTKSTWLFRGSTFTVWLLLTIILSWQHFSIRQRDRQRRAIIENQGALNEAQRLGLLGSWQQQADCKFYTLSEPLQSLIGVPHSKLALSDLHTLLHPNEKDKFLSSLQDLSSGKLTTISTQHRLKVGDHYRWFEHKVARSKEGGLGGIIRDIQTIKEQERQVAKLEAYDPLTGASNRHHFQTLVTQNLALCERRNTSLALMLINIDDFRAINERFNQTFGDELLKQMALRLIKVARKTDFVARLAGDTFAVALIDVGTTSQSVLAVEYILQQLKEPYYFSAEVFPQLTVGVAMYPDDALEFETLLQRAEQTLVNAKSKKRGHYSYYSAELDEKTNRRQQILANLPAALKNNHLYLVFQPRVSSTGEHSSLSMEALVRWQDPELGFVSPGEFIPIAEGTSLIADIGTWVMDAAFSTLSQFKDQLPRGLSISINLSPRQLEDINLVKNVTRAMERYNIDANYIELEVTEHSIAVESKVVLENMKQLSDLGFKFALDDFGTGYSNLSMLQSLPLNVLKIDMSFIRNIGVSDKSNELVRAIIDLGHTLGLHTVAEGVETIEQVIFLEKLGCEELQGYYFYKPAPIEALISKLS